MTPLCIIYLSTYLGWVDEGSIFPHFHAGNESPIQLSKHKSSPYWGGLNCYWWKIPTRKRQLVHDGSYLSIKYSLGLEFRIVDSNWCRIIIQNRRLKIMKSCMFITVYYLMWYLYMCNFFYRSWKSEHGQYTAYDSLSDYMQHYNSYLGSEIWPSSNKMTFKMIEYLKPKSSNEM